MDLSDMKADDQLGKADIERVLNLSDMIYLRGVAASPVVVRQQKESVVDGGRSSTYGPSQRFYLTFQTGTDFIDPLNSYLCFTVVGATASGSAQASVANFSRAGAVRLLQDTVITARTGIECDRAEQNALLQYHLMSGLEPELVEYNYNGMFMASPRAAGIPNVQASPTNLAGEMRANELDRLNASLVTSSERVCIPLKFVAPIFAAGKLMPPHLARGLRIEVLTATLAAAFIRGTVTPDPVVTNYTISDVHCLLDCYTLADSVQSYLNQEWAATPDGLVYEYKSYNTTTTTIAASSCNVEVTRPVSMALHAFATVRAQSNIDGGNGFDALTSRPVDDADIAQWRMGSTFLPNQSITTKVKFYSEMIYWQSKLRHEMPTGAQWRSFVGGSATSIGNLGKYCVVLNRSNVLELAGQGLNNSSTLSFNATLASIAGNHLVNVFLCHLRRAVCFIENIIIEI